METTSNHAQETLDRMGKSRECSWCKHPRKSVYRAGMCTHCYRIKRNLVRLHREVQRLRKTAAPHPRFGVIPFQLDHEYRIALEMAEAARCEGRKYGSIHRDDITNLKLEHEFSFISKRFLKRDLYRNDAWLFECFSASQKRHLFYITSLMTREFLRNNRRAIAAGQVSGLSIDQVISGRSHGSFRVEEI